MRILILLLLFVTSMPGVEYVIAGQVVQRGSGAPLRRVRVSLASMGPQQKWFSVVSGNQGEFSFGGLAAGKYSLWAELGGQRHSYKENDGFSTAVITGANQDLEHLVFAVGAPAGIAGTVTDEEGEPVANAQVLVFRRAILTGRWKTQMIGDNVTTNRAGEFRFRNLSPGSYLVAMQGRPWFAQYQPRSSDARQNQLDSIYPLTYYPGSTNPDDARPVAVEEGRTSELQMILQAAPSIHIRLEGAPAGMDPQLSQIGPAGIEIPLFNITSFSSPGQLELSGIAAGHYFVQLAKYDPNGVEWLGRTSVTITSDSTVNLGELQKTSIAGRLTGEVEGGMQNAIVWLENVATRDERGVARCPVAADGTFHFDHRTDGYTPPGRYELRLDGNLYLKSVTVKGADYSRGELEVREGAQIQLSITAGEATKVSGVAAKDGHPVSGAMVLLIPQDFSHGAYIPRDQSDSDGTFALTSAAPGRYTLLAIEDGRDLAYHDPAAIAAYLKKGQQIELPLLPGVQTKVEVQRQTP